MRQLAMCLLLIASIAACENSASPFPGIGGGGGAVSQAQATGDWSFTVQRTTTFPCTGSTLASGQVLLAHIVASTDGSVTEATSTWQSPASGVLRPLSGLVRFSDGRTDLILRASTGSNSALELIGTMTSTGTVSGTLTDPGAGFSPPVFGVACEFTTAGTKTG